MKLKSLSAGIASFLVFLVILTVFSAAAASAATEIPPPISGIEIFEYEDFIIQQAGTTGSYEVQIKNIGVLHLVDVRLEAEKIQEEWFSSDSTLDLEFGDVGILQYKLILPADASGLHAFSLVARGSNGVDIVSDVKPVVLNVLALAGQPPTETTQPVPQQPPATQPPIISIPENLSELIGGLETLEVGDLKTYPEIVFSKFRAAVTYVRTTARTIFANEMLMYKTAAALFVVMLILAGIRKVMMG